MMVENAFMEEQLKTNALKYFHGDLLASHVWINKYALKDEKEGFYLESNPDESIQRLANEIYRAELKYPNPLSLEEIYETIRDFGYFLFGGSIQFGLGNKKQISSLGNCFFIDNGSDSYGGIFNIDESMVQLMKRRGGVGITIEHLRPGTALVNNAAKTSTGAISFMPRYSNSTREVAQGGRRGALMITIDVRHPDVKQYIVIKDDLTKITGANISVKVNDEFMNAVKNDDDFILKYPVDDPQPVFPEQMIYNKLYRREDKTYVMKVKAKEIWNLIIKMAHKNAEPGVMFWDNIIRESPADCYAKFGFRTKGTNPCIAGNTLIAVADGRNAVSIKQLSEENKDVPVYSTNPTTGRVEIKWGRNPRLTKEKTEVWKLKLDDGSELIATPDHQILTTNSGYKELKDLVNGESISPFYSFESNGYRQISRTGAQMSGGNFRNQRQYRLIYDFYNGYIDAKTYAIHHKDFDSKNDANENLKKMLHEEHKNLHVNLMKGKLNPYHKMTNEWKQSFASHPGKSNGRYSGFSNEQLLEKGKEIFLIEGNLTRDIWYKYARENGMPLRLSNNFRFGSFTNFKNQVATNHKVESVEFYGYEDVYNITVDDNHNYNVITSFEDNRYVKSSGIAIKNCGEVPLSPYDSCRLGSVNIYAFVIDPFTPEARFDWDLFAFMSRRAQRFMDDIVTLEQEKIEEILIKIENDPEDPEIKRTEYNLWKKVLKVLLEGRRTGVGMLGLGDAMAALGIKYGTKEGSDFAEKITESLAVECYKESVIMAMERGCFPLFDFELEKDNPYIQRILSHFTDKELQEFKTYGRRNIALLSIAPTGTLAMEAGVTSGIEPVFMTLHRRRRKVNQQEARDKVVFVDLNGDAWEEYNVIHPKFIEWFRITSGMPFTTAGARGFLENADEEQTKKLIAASPWHGAESHEIDYLEKVRMQGRIQNWIDHSISVTHNLPENITLEEVNNIYFEAWKAGCKGCTIYREGSRSGVLLSNKVEETKVFPEHNAPKRPKELKADYYLATAKGIKYAVIIGLLEDKPYEVFAFENPTILENCKGKIIKVKKGEYTFVSDLGKIDNIHLAADKIEERALTITASMILRHGAPITKILNVIKKIDENITSFSSVVRRTLSRYISEGGGEPCPECGEPMVMQDGCMKCINTSCGYSKCG